MARVEKTVEIDRPLRMVYDQWTQFEEFPRFMEGVESVTQIGDAMVHWVAEIGGKRKEWDARITEQVPDQVIAWEGFGDADNRGRIFFEPTLEGGTKVSVAIEYETEGAVEWLGDALGVLDRRVEGDLERFKSFIEERRGRETGAWRGEIHQRPTGTDA